jgi:hypothetical protein
VSGVSLADTRKKAVIPLAATGEAKSIGLLTPGL